MATSLESTTLNRIAFQAYKELRNLAKNNNLEKELEIPQLVIVGETSVGKSMLVQNFLQFPCAFSTDNVGTRCPISYRLIYNPELQKNHIQVKKPTLNRLQDLSNYLKDLMTHIEMEYASEGGFRSESEEIEIEGGSYQDFEIVDVPGLVGGDKNENIRKAVATIVESYVRDPHFKIVLLKEANQPKENSHGVRVIHDLCTSQKAIASNQPPRMDYQEHMITIQTKFDIFMQQKANGTEVNNAIAGQLAGFRKCYFTNMIFDGFSMKNESFDRNSQYLQDLSKLEKNKVDQWIQSINQHEGVSSGKFQQFDSRYRSLIGIATVRKQIHKFWVESFVSALPKLLQVVRGHLDKTQQKYNTLFEQLSISDPNSIKMQYEKYVKEFRSTFRKYVACRAEINSCFPVEKAMTYEDVINRFLVWDRQHIAQTRWQAYLAPNKLYGIGENGFSQRLKNKIQGAGQFERILQVFCVMTLMHEPQEITSDWIASAQGALYGGTTDRANLEKAAREITCTLIGKTFLHGICWLVQVFTFLLDKFKKDVTNYLLGVSEKYTRLKNHKKFLKLFDLAYHKTVRNMIRNVVHVIREIRNMRSAYAHYDITFRLLNMVQSIPKYINSGSSNEIAAYDSRNNNRLREQNNERSFVTSAAPTSSKNIPMDAIFKLAFGSGIFPAHQADQLTSHRDSVVKSVVAELYTSSAMLLVNDIRASFNTNVVIKIQAPNETEDNDAYDSLLSCIRNMNSSQILEMNDSNVTQIREKMQGYATRIDDFTDCLAYINSLNQENKSSSRMDRESDESRRFEQNIKKDRESRENQRRKKENERLSPSSPVSHDMYDAPREETYADEDQKNILTLNNYNADQYLLELFRNHDDEDLKECLLPNELLGEDSSIASGLQDYHAASPTYNNEDSMDSSVEGTDTLQQSVFAQSQHPPTHSSTRNSFSGFTNRKDASTHGNRATSVVEPNSFSNIKSLTKHSDNEEIPPQIRYNMPDTKPSSSKTYQSKDKITNQQANHRKENNTGSSPSQVTPSNTTRSSRSDSNTRDEYDPLIKSNRTVNNQYKQN